MFTCHFAALGGENFKGIFIILSTSFDKPRVDDVQYTINSLQLVSAD